MKRLWLVLTVLMLGCTDEAATRDAVEAMGMTDIRIKGYAPFACSDDDWYETEFTATNAHGQQVTGVVCCGLIMKSCTVRW